MILTESSRKLTCFVPFLSRAGADMRNFLRVLGVVVVVPIIMTTTGCENFSGPAKGEKKVVSDACDTANVSYSKTIQPLLKNNCYSCHSNTLQTDGVNLEGYAKAKQYADATLLVGVTSRLPGYDQMPPTGPLSDCDKAVIRAWVHQGAKNN